MRNLLSRYLLDPSREYLKNLYLRVINRMKRRWLELMPSFISRRAIKHPLFASLRNETNPTPAQLNTNQASTSKTVGSKQQINRLQVMQAKTNEPESIVKSISPDELDKQSSSQIDFDQFEDDLDPKGNAGITPTKDSGSGIFRTISSLIGGNNSNDVAIPPKRSTNKKSSKVTIQIDDSETVYRPSIEISFSSTSSSSDFITQAKKYEHRTEKSAEPVPFMQYWPTYSSMNKSQQKWYFYWRTQLRQGNRLPTDTSYLFVHVYEVLHLVGFKSKNDAFKYLANFWRYYRKLQSKLDNYLPDWIADFCIVHDVPVKPLEWYGKITKLGSIGDPDLLIEAWLTNDSDFSHLSTDIIFNLANYNPTKSKFYKQNAETVDLDSAYKRGLTAIDNLLKSTTNQTLFEMYQSVSTRAIRRTPFAGAVHSFPRDEVEIATVHYWYSNEELGNALKNIIKGTENIIREQNGYRHKLRDVSLHKEWQAVLEDTFGTKSKLQSQTKKAKPKLEIDLSEIAQLTQESEEIRSRLIVDVEQIEDTSESTVTSNSIGNKLELDLSDVAELLSESESAQTNPILDDIHQIDDDFVEVTDQQSTSSKSATGYIERPADTPDDLLTDLPEVTQIIGRSEDNSSKLIALMQANNWEYSSDALQTAFEGQFVNVIIDEINDRAFDEIGDSLLFEEDDQWVVLEEYRDEIEYILAHPDYQNQVLESSKDTEQYSELDDDWSQFASMLQPMHWCKI